MKKITFKRDSELMLTAIEKMEYIRNMNRRLFVVFFTVFLSIANNVKRLTI